MSADTRSARLCKGNGCDVTMCWSRRTLRRMNDLDTRLVALDLLIARTKPLKERQKADLKKIKSYKGDNGAAKELLAKTKKALKSAKAERKTIIVKLLKAQDAARKKTGASTQ